MLVHIARECHPANNGDFYLVEIDQDSRPYERKRSVEIPDELVVRYEKADCEHGEVQDLLQEIYDRQDWPRFTTDEEFQIEIEHREQKMRLMKDAQEAAGHPAGRQQGGNKLPHCDTG